MAGRDLPATWLGRAAYREVWALQESLRERVLGGDEGAERILLVEHEPVVTLGRSGQVGNVLLSPDELTLRGVELVRSSRGGDATYHGPGQLVIYPIVQLARGVVAHVEAIGRAIADELSASGVGGAMWQRSPAGVWVSGAKIAACGIHVRRRVAIHGFALNVTAESMVGFQSIVPCGLVGSRVTCMESLAPSAVRPLDQIGFAIVARLCAAWGRSPVCSCDHALPR